MRVGSYHEKIARANQAIMLMQSTCLAFLAASADALTVGIAMAAARATVSTRAASSVMLWDPSEDASNDELLKPPPPPDDGLMAPREYVPPPPEYSVPEDGCEMVTLDQYASTVFGNSAIKQQAWVCAEDELKEAQVWSRSSGLTHSHTCVPVRTHTLVTHPTRSLPGSPRTGQGRGVQPGHA